ncbi:hypothetical protein [Endozoicomonas acroporae]|uniref:hypothetical protein n=1 Tax=Endozoicomonas acroporae TaxID=1701104 RepID=UPI003D7AAE95
MFQYQPQEVFPRQGARLFFAGFTVEVREGHLSELNDINNLFRCLYGKYNQNINKMVVDPSLPGCGFINPAKGDLINQRTLIEIKSGERKFSVIDLRQILTYCTLNHFSESPYNIKFIELYNPRMGISYRDNIDNLCRV